MCINDCHKMSMSHVILSPRGFTLYQNGVTHDPSTISYSTFFFLSFSPMFFHRKQGNFGQIPSNEYWGNVDNSYTPILNIVKRTLQNTLFSALQKSEISSSILHILSSKYQNTPHHNHNTLNFRISGSAKFLWMVWKNTSFLQITK